MKFSVRLLYLYLFSFVGLLISVIGAIQLIDLGLRATVFTQADLINYPELTKPVCDGADCPPVQSKEELERQARIDVQRSRERQMSNSLAMIAIGMPLYLYHWSVIKKESKNG